MLIMMVLVVCAAVLGTIIGKAPWIRPISIAYLACFAIVTVIKVVNGEWLPNMLLVPTLAFVGLCFQRVSESKDKRREQASQPGGPGDGSTRA